MNAKPTQRRGKLPFSAETQAAILRLYVEQRVSGRQTAEKLHLDINSVHTFLRRGGVMRPRGFHHWKLDPAQREQLVRQFPTTTDIVLARRYPITRQRVRQIREQLGCVSSRVLQQASAARARAKRHERQSREQEQARQVRQQRKQAAELPAWNRLSERWLAGATIPALATEYGVSEHCLAGRIHRGRTLYPEKFPIRRTGLGPAWKRAVQRVWQAYWRETVPDIDRLSRQWKAGATVKQLAHECGVRPTTMYSRIRHLRQRFPAKFPCRLDMKKRDVRAGDALNPTANRRKHLHAHLNDR